MSSIYIVEDEDRDTMGIVKSLEDGVKFLFVEKKVNAYSEWCYDKNKYEYCPAWEVLGFDSDEDFNYENFMKKMNGKTIEEIADFIAYHLEYYFQEEYVWEE